MIQSYQKRSKEVAWALELPVPISYSHVVLKKIIFRNALILLNSGPSINCPIFDEIFNTLADPLDLAAPLKSFADHLGVRGPQVENHCLKLRRSQMKC